VKVLKPWTRRGTDSFLGQSYCQGQEICFSHQNNSIALNLMGDWCGPSLTPND
jgi:hypothetical protein